MSKNKTVLITGSSTGIGKETSIYFAKHNFNVIATMRNPDKAKDLAKITSVDVQKMDVTDSDSIERVINYGIEKYGKIDVLINNAGIGGVGTFETTDDDFIRTQYETNVFGVMNTIKKILPHFRKKRSGLIINVSSVAGLIAIPGQSIYDSTKFATVGFTEALYYELNALGIGVKIVLPGATKSDFYQSAVITDTTNFSDYQAYQKRVVDNLVKGSNDGATSESVAAIIYKAATDGKNKLRYIAGKDSALFTKMRWLLPLGTFMKIVNSRF